VSELSDCLFYHTVELPGLGLQRGFWDLRPNIDAYLSAVDFRGQRVLEVGTWDGYLAVELERRGASVIAFDLGGDIEPDFIPVQHPAIEHARAHLAAGRQRRANAYALVHRLFRSSAELVYGHACNLPAAIGSVDYCFIGNVLQHLRDPLGALTSAATLARRGIIVTEANWMTGLDPGATLMYLMTPEKIAQGDPTWMYCWWQVTPGLVAAWLKVLGFEVTEQTEHRQRFEPTGLEIPHFTIVARRR